MRPRRHSVGGVPAQGDGSPLLHRHASRRPSKRAGVGGAKRSRLRPVLQYLADDHRFDGSMAQRLKRRGAPQVLRNGDLPRSFHRSWLSGKHGGIGLTCGDRSTLGNEPYGLYPSHLAIVRRHRIRPGDVRRR